MGDGGGGAGDEGTLIVCPICRVVGLRPGLRFWIVVASVLCLLAMRVNVSPPTIM